MTRTDDSNHAARRSRVIRNAIFLTLAAVAVYVAFFVVMVERSSQGLT